METNRKRDLWCGATFAGGEKNAYWDGVFNWGLRIWATRIPFGRGRLTTDCFSLHGCFLGVWGNDIPLALFIAGEARLYARNGWGEIFTT